tara:strand:- start:342 stop:539 length:198 start_codon:yes stop_codon:yes gene_type:complete
MRYKKEHIMLAIDLAVGDEGQKSLEVMSIVERLINEEKESSPSWSHTKNMIVELGEEVNMKSEDK